MSGLATKVLLICLLLLSGCVPQLYGCFDAEESAAITIGKAEGTVTIVVPTGTHMAICVH